MTVEEAEKLFQVIEAIYDYRADPSIEGSLRVSDLKEEFLDLIVEGQDAPQA